MLSIADAVIVVFGCIIIRETYAPILLKREADALHRTEGTSTAIRGQRSQGVLLRVNPSSLRSLELSVKRPVIQLMAFVMAVGFGMYTLVLSVYATVFIDRYHQSPSIGSLRYIAIAIAIAIGAALASQCGRHLMDFVLLRLKAQSQDGETIPEFRVPMLAIGAVTVPIGLFWLGWAIAYHLSWVMVDVGATIFSCGAFVIGQAVLAYLLDRVRRRAGVSQRRGTNFEQRFGLRLPTLYTEALREFGLWLGIQRVSIHFDGYSSACPAPSFALGCKSQEPSRAG